MAYRRGDHKNYKTTPQRPPGWFWGTYTEVGGFLGGVENIECGEDTVRFEIMKIFVSRQDWRAMSIKLMPEPSAQSPKLKKINNVLVKATGKVGTVIPGQIYQATGIPMWYDNSPSPQYHEWNLDLIDVRQAPLDDAESMRRALKKVKGIGGQYADRIINRYGADSRRMLDEEFEAVCTDCLRTRLDGAKAQKIRESWIEFSKRLDVEQMLERHRLDGPTIKRVYDYYETYDIMDRIKEDPYDILNVEGVSFRSADGLALECGIDPIDPRRIGAYMLQGLWLEAGNGHCFSPPHTAARKASIEYGGLDAQTILDKYWSYSTDPTTRLSMMTRMIEDQDGQLWPEVLARYEEQIAQDLRALVRSPRRFQEERLIKALQKVKDRFAAEQATKPEDQRDPWLSDEQEQAIMDCLRSNVSVLCGPAGTGKTTATTITIQIAQEYGGIVALCSPTGKAAKRATEVTGFEATTVHSLVKATPSGRPIRNRIDPLDWGLYLIDESGMLDTKVAWMVLEAIPPGSAVMFIGDPNQLKPVGPGKCFDSIISAAMRIAERTEEIVVRRLTKVFRMAATKDAGVCGMLDAAYAMLEGLDPTIPHSSHPDPRWRKGRPFNQEFTHIDLVDTHAIRNKVADLYEGIAGTAEGLPYPELAGFMGREYAEKRAEQIRLAPPVAVCCYGQRDGRGQDAGAVDLNLIVRDILNPADGRLPETRIKGTTYRTCDRVLWLRRVDIGGEDSEPEQDPYTIVNGESLSILACTAEYVELLPDGSPRTIFVKPDEWEGSLGYCMVTHKLQGSEYPVVVIVLRPGDFLSRSWLYTTATRAKKRVIVLGDIRLAWKGHTKDNDRRTRLEERIVSAMHIEGAERHAVS